MYAERKARGISAAPGTIDVRGRADGDKIIIGLNGQFGLGKCKRDGPDTREKREAYFQQGLEAIVQWTYPEATFAFPYL